ncbi:hypothetical protein L9F63_002928, partial [Diploptera punctata]
SGQSLLIHIKPFFGIMQYSQYIKPIYKFSLLRHCNLMKVGHFSIIDPSKLYKGSIGVI